MREFAFADKQPNYKRINAGDVVLLSNLICTRISADEFEPEGSYSGKAFPNPNERFAFMVNVSWVQNFAPNQLTLHGHIVENQQPYGVEVTVHDSDAMIRVFHQPLPLRY